MEVTKTERSRMFKDRRQTDRRQNEANVPNQERRSGERRDNKDFNDAPWWLQRSYLEEPSDTETCC